MKRIIFLALVGMILLAVVALGYKIVRGNAEKDAAALRIRTLPDFRFFTDSMGAITPAHVPPEKALVIIHFLPRRSKRTCRQCRAVWRGAYSLGVGGGKQTNTRVRGMVRLGTSSVIYSLSRQPPQLWADL